MYITPELLTDHDWNVLADAAKWSRARAAILKDVHWVGGDPAQLAVYGWAAWSLEGWVVTLRNPADHAQDYQLVLSDALELPDGAKGRYMASFPFKVANGAPLKVISTDPVPIHLGALEVTTIEWLAKK